MLVSSSRYCRTAAKQSARAPAAAPQSTPEKHRKNYNACALKVSQACTLPVFRPWENQRTRWGSCSLRSGIRLNWRLIFFPLDSLDYVIAHELAHLREMNHSQRFWMVVEGLYPNFRQARDELKKRAADVPLWSIK